jgi:CheY-like chemotaxis protein
MNESTLLLVEDEEDSVTLFAYAFNKLAIACTLQVTKDGIEAIEYLEGTGHFADRQKYPLPGLVVLDLRLPGATGFEVLRRIRANAALEKLTVIVFTASASEKDIAQAYALRANAYVVKPAQLKDLISIVGSMTGFWLTLNQPA